jgi:hypothetical protein
VIQSKGRDSKNKAIKVSRSSRTRHNRTASLTRASERQHHSLFLKDLCGRASSSSIKRGKYDTRFDTSLSKVRKAAQGTTGQFHLLLLPIEGDRVTNLIKFLEKATATIDGREPFVFRFG